MRSVTYPFANPSLDAGDEDDDDVSLQAMWPAAITFVIPQGLYIHKEAAKVMWWDEGTRAWSSDGVDDVEWTPQAIKFRTLHFTPIAITQVIKNY